MHLINSVPSFYTATQLDAYLSKIGYPAAEQEAGGSPLKKLQLVIRLHLVAFRWSNTDMHYTKDCTMDVSPQGVYHILVEDGTKGTYCFGHNTLLLGMLRAMGFRAYPGSSRVLLGVTSTPTPELFHMLLFVQPFPDSTETYIADVGYGGSSLCRPILLSDDPNNFVYGTTKSEKHRLVKSTLPDSVVSGEKLWEMQLWRTTHPTWTSLHIFSESEFHLPDFTVLSFALCHAPNIRGRVSLNILVTSTFFVDDNDHLEGDLGKYILFGSELKKSVGEKSEVIKAFEGREEGEKERVRAIKEYFGVVVDEADVAVIQGRPAGLW